jgi:hypothetical protein
MEILGLWTGLALLSGIAARIKGRSGVEFYFVAMALLSAAFFME